MALTPFHWLNVDNTAKAKVNKTGCELAFDFGNYKTMQYNSYWPVNSTAIRHTASHSLVPHRSSQQKPAIKTLALAPPSHRHTLNNIEIFLTSFRL